MAESENWRDRSARNTPVKTRAFSPTATDVKVGGAVVEGFFAENSEQWFKTYKGSSLKGDYYNVQGSIIDSNSSGHSRDEGSNVKGLQWMIKSIQNSRSKDPFFNATIITTNTALKNVLKSPNGDGAWIIGASKFNGKIFMRGLAPKSSGTDKAATPQPNAEQNESPGNRFEELVTEKMDDVRYAVVSRTVGEIKILLKAEIDCVENANAGNDFVEIKTSKHEFNSYNFNKWKPLEYWSQCFMPGIQKVLFATTLKDNGKFKVEAIKMLDLKDLVPCEVSQKCLSYMSRFIEFVTSKITSEGDDCATVYKFQPNGVYFSFSSDDATDSEFVLRKEWFD